MKSRVNMNRVNQWPFIGHKNGLMVCHQAFFMAIKIGHIMGI
jgi:hypothetical protein